MRRSQQNPCHLSNQPWTNTMVWVSLHLSSDSITGPSEIFSLNLPEGVYACPFLEHGCHKISLDEMEVKMHIRDDRTFHLMLLCRAVIELRRRRQRILHEKTEQMLELDNMLSYPIAVIKKYGFVQKIIVLSGCVTLHSLFWPRFELSCMFREASRCSNQCFQSFK
ncbi:unnamed protein product [Haemonchus placei]|uniref:FBD domain-containing protein n=1 Tax=Haemonchus placei TaxID=6290 RepID=A0A0N4VV75_HAEPC|nr:unnamed protein product [Haemonchus placei]